MNLENITVNKQSSIRIEGNVILYFDPIEISDERKDADYIFITHEHFDHFDPKTILKIMKDNTVIVAPESMRKKVLGEIEISEEQCVFMNPGDIKELSSISVEAIPAYNNLMPFHTKGSKWLGYIVNMDNTRYYIAGDTDANPDNKKVQCDIAFIPVGGKFTMDKKHAAEFAIELMPKAVIPIHYGEMVGKVTDGADFKSLVESKTAEIQIELKL